MALDHQIGIAAKHFNISTPEGWCAVRPEWIRQVHGCGPSTIDHLRIYLAARGLTLQDDQTPEYWQRNLSGVRIGTQVAETDKSVVAPFCVLIDSQEKQPFGFQGFRADASQGHRPLVVPIKWKSLGPTHGDYSVEGLEYEVHVERKSVQDAIGTFLSHGERRERWLATLSFLAEIPCGAVVVEGTRRQVIESIEARGKRPKETLQSAFKRQVEAWIQDYRVPFYFDDDRRMAEETTLAILRRHHRHVTGQKNAPAQDVESIIASL